jgi:hypothetical protein
VLQGRYKEVANKGVARVLQVLYKEITRVVQGYSKGVIRV